MHDAAPQCTKKKNMEEDILKKIGFKETFDQPSNYKYIHSDGWWSYVEFYISNGVITAIYGSKVFKLTLDNKISTRPAEENLDLIEALIYEAS